MLTYELEQYTLSRSEEASMRAAGMVRDARYLEQLTRIISLLALLGTLAWVIS